VEGATEQGYDVQYSIFGETFPQCCHNLTISEIKAFNIDVFPVTNAEYYDFLQSSGYSPTDAASGAINYLAHWTIQPDGSRAPSPSSLNQPVRYISLDDASAFCQYYKQRLPEEWEYQYAAQGLHQRSYPWGNVFNESLVPAVFTGRDISNAPPSDVDAFAPQACSEAGVCDLVGNVWQFTSVFQDDHSRRVILRGGTYYNPQGSSWYFPRTYLLSQHNQYLLMAPSLDRAGTLGFRCVAPTQ